MSLKCPSSLQVRQTLEEEQVRQPGIRDRQVGQAPLTTVKVLLMQVKHFVPSAQVLQLAPNSVQFVHWHSSVLKKAVALQAAQSGLLNE